MYMDMYIYIYVYMAESVNLPYLFCHFWEQNSWSVQTTENFRAYCRFWGTLKVPFGYL